MTRLRLWLLLCTYAPYLGAGIRVTRVSRDLREIDVRMRLRWYNRNYVGTQFGGSLYSMVDPFYMLMLLEALGPGFIVWDQSAQIRFVRPGRGTVFARFRLTDEMVAEVRDALASADVVRPRWSIDVVDEQGVRVAAITQTLFVRRRPASGVRQGG